MLLAATNEIAIIICNPCGEPEARIWSPRFLNLSTLRRKQYVFSAGSNGFNWICKMIGIKIFNQLQNLNYLSRRKPVLNTEIEKTSFQINTILEQINALVWNPEENYKKLRYFEAIAARYYWQIIGKQLPDPYKFTKRIKKNPLDGFNPSINYLYGMLRNQIETAILGTGLDPALGCMHRDGFKMPSLVFDLMEPFRPLVDSLLLRNILSGKLKNMFEINEEKIYILTRQGRKCLIEMFNEHLQQKILFQNRKSGFQNHILLETRNLAKMINQQ